MPLSPIDFEFHTWKQIDLYSIPSMTPDERAEMLSRYTKLRDDLAAALEQEGEALRKQAPMPGYWAMRKLSKHVRSHRSVESALERLQKAIAENEGGDLIDGNIR